MKITKDNLASEFENYKKFLKDDDMRSKVKDTIEISEFYDEDADIKKAVDEMVKMVNEQIAKNEKKSSQQKKEQEPKDIELIWDLAANTYELWIDHKKVDDSVFTTIEGLAEYIQLHYPELMKRKDVILQLENYGWKKNKTSIPKPKQEPKKQEKWEKFPIAKYNVGDWVTTKDHDGKENTTPILISEWMETPDGRIVYTADGGQYDFFEDSIVRQVTEPKFKIGDYVKFKVANAAGRIVEITPVKGKKYEYSLKYLNKDGNEVVTDGVMESLLTLTSEDEANKINTKTTKEAKPKEKKEPKTKEPKAKKEPKPDQYASATPVEALSPEVKLIKRVITLQGKTMKKANSEKTNNPRAILNAIQRAIRTKQIRKTSKYADEIMYAQDALIRMVNGSLNGTMSGADVINLTRYDDLVKVAHAEVVSEIAKIAAQFIKIQEKEGKEKEAETLLKRIEKSNEKGEEIDGMKKALKNYVEGKTTKLKASEQVLKGLHGIVDVNFESGDVVNSTTIEGKHFDTLDFHGRWEGFFGKPSPAFKFMFYGKPGNGKSTFALQFAGYLSKELGKSVLYVANEEGFGYTLQEKVKRLNVANSNLYLCDSVPEDLSQFDVVFLDSVNNLGLEPEDLKAMPAGKAYVYIFQTTKDGNYMGKQEFAHDVDAVVRVENFNAYKDKNRYGGEIQEFKVG